MKISSLLLFLLIIEMAMLSLVSCVSPAATPSPSLTGNPSITDAQTSTPDASAVPSTEYTSPLPTDGTKTLDPVADISKLGLTVSMNSSFVSGSWYLDDCDLERLEAEFTDVVWEEIEKLPDISFQYRLFAHGTLSGSQYNYGLSVSGKFYVNIDNKKILITELSYDSCDRLIALFDEIEERPDDSNLLAKPVIYLYPEEPTLCSVKLELDGRLTCTYPKYQENGWQNFTAYPDGTLIFPDRSEYYCLYWEGTSNRDFDLSKGFCIKGEDSAEFLSKTLPLIGLTPREANEMIIYWLPILEKNEYNLISFQGNSYTDSAKLDIYPAPDSLLRVFMAIVPLDEPIDIEPQELEAFERKGFTVVEWGGSLLSENYIN